MPSLLLVSALCYLIWANLLSDICFHRLWSLALLLLWFLTTQLFNSPFSASNVPLAVLVLLVFIICIVLSPAQRLLFHKESTHMKKGTLDIFNSENGQGPYIESVPLSL